MSIESLSSAVSHTHHDLSVFWVSVGSPGCIQLNTERLQSLSVCCAFPTRPRVIRRRIVPCQLSERSSTLRRASTASLLLRSLLTRARNSLKRSGRGSTKAST